MFEDWRYVKVQSLFFPLSILMLLLKSIFACSCIKVVQLQVWLSCRSFSWTSFQHWIYRALTFYTFCKGWIGNWKHSHLKYQTYFINRLQKNGSKNKIMLSYVIGMSSQNTITKIIHIQWRYCEIFLVSMSSVCRYLKEYWNLREISSLQSFLLNTRFFIRKKFIRKWGSNCQNLKKIVRKSRVSIFNIKCFYWPKIDSSLLLHSKC